MALATRCPNCQALFRVVADQLKLRGGLVRCGSCRGVFDAISTLSYVDDATIADEPSPPPGSRDSTVDTRGAADVEPSANDSSEPAEREAAPAESSISVRLDETPEGEALPQSAAVDREPATPEQERAATDTSVERHPDSGAIDAAAPATEAQPLEADAAAGADRLAAQDASAPDPESGPRSEDGMASLQPDPASEAPSAPYDWDAADVHTRMATEGGDEQPAAAAAAPTFLQSQTQARGFSIVFGGGAVLLALLMLLQLGIVFRSEILVRIPHALPLLSQACRLFNCTATWPARSELLAIVGSELQAIPGTNVLELTTTVRNRAAHRQPLPAIELTLTDAANRTVVRKVFTPADYLAASDDATARLAAGIDSGGETTIRLAFEAQGQNATGFGFLVYPFHL